MWDQISSSKHFIMMEVSPPGRSKQGMEGSCSKGTIVLFETDRDCRLVQGEVESATRLPHAPGTRPGMPSVLRTSKD